MLWAPTLSPYLETDSVGIYQASYVFNGIYFKYDMFSVWL